MKKSFLYLCLAVLTLTLTGCPPTPNEGELQAIAIKPAELTMSPGESVRLSLTTTPSKLPTAGAVWESSDEEVVTVSANGTVEAVALGEADITVTLKGKTASCHITVVDILDNLAFTGLFFYDFDEVEGLTFNIEGKDTTWLLDTIQSRAGDSYVCCKVLSHVEVMSEGFYWDNEGKLAGASKGAMIEFDAPFYWAKAEWNPALGGGTVFVLGYWDAYEHEELETQSGYPYSIDKPAYIAAMDTYVQNWLKYYESQGADQAAGQAASAALSEAGDYITNARLTIYEYHSVDEGYSQDGYYSSYIPDLLVKELHVYAAGDGASEYMLGLSYTDIKGAELKSDFDEATGVEYVYGVKFQATEKGEELADSENVYEGTEHTYQTGVKPTNAPMRAIRVNLPTPAVKARMAAQKAMVKPAFNNTTVTLK